MRLTPARSCCRCAWAGSSGCGSSGYRRAGALRCLRAPGNGIDHGLVGCDSQRRVCDAGPGSAAGINGHAVQHDVIEHRAVFGWPGHRQQPAHVDCLRATRATVADGALSVRSNFIRSTLRFRRHHTNPLGVLQRCLWQPGVDTVDDDHRHMCTAMHRAVTDDGHRQPVSDCPAGQVRPRVRPASGRQTRPSPLTPVRHPPGLIRPLWARRCHGRLRWPACVPRSVWCPRRRRTQARNRPVAPAVR